MESKRRGQLPCRGDSLARSSRGNIIKNRPPPTSEISLEDGLYFRAAKLLCTFVKAEEKRIQHLTVIKTSTQHGKRKEFKALQVAPRKAQAASMHASDGTKTCR